MSRFQEIDLSTLPPPDVVQALDFEVIYQEILAAFRAVMGEGWNATLESDPVVKLLELAAYREMLVRSRVNDAARACMLAYAVGPDLDHIAGNLLVQRLEGESDDRLRRRAQMAFEGYTTAGSIGAYEFHALAASVHVTDVYVDSPTAGTVRVVIQCDDADMEPDPSLVAQVGAYLSAEDRRPLCDTVSVVAVDEISYTLTATVYSANGPSDQTVIDAVNAAVTEYTASVNRIGVPVRLGALYAALYQPGVTNVTLTAPTTDLTPTVLQAYRCTSVALTFTVG